MIKPSYVDLVKVGAHYASPRSSTGPSLSHLKSTAMTSTDEAFNRTRSGRQALVTGRSRVASEITLDEQVVSYAVLWLGDQNLFGGASADLSDGTFGSMCEGITEQFKRGEMQRTIALIDGLFARGQSTPCTLKSLFKDEQIAISKVISELELKKALLRYRDIYDGCLSIMLFLKDIGLTLPLEMRAAAEVVLANALRDALQAKDIDLDLLTAIVEQVDRLDVNIDRMMISLDGQRRVESELGIISKEPDDLSRIAQVAALLRLLLKLKLPSTCGMRRTRSSLS